MELPVKLFPEPDSRGCAGADRSTTMFAGGAEWSATGLPGRSLAGDSFGQADNKFAAARSAARALWNGPPDSPRCPRCGAKCVESVFDSMCARRTLSRLTEMNGVDYLEGQLARWEEASASGKHAMGGKE